MSRYASDKYECRYDIYTSRQWSRAVPQVSEGGGVYLQVLCPVLLDGRLFRQPHCPDSGVGEHHGGHAVVVGFGLRHGAEQPDHGDKGNKGNVSKSESEEVRRDA